MILFYLACSSNELISVSPPDLAWNDINFADPIPENGYAPLELIITNKMDNDVEVSISNFDWEHLCLQGYSESSELELPTLTVGDSFILRPSVCKYLPENGERDTEVSGSININATSGKNSLTVNVPWVFTPVLDFQDSG